MLGNRALIISEEAYAHIAEYARFARIPLEKAASEAIVKWMEETGAPIMTAFQKRREARAGLTDQFVASLDQFGAN
jgi:hypothetical protein